MYNLQDISESYLNTVINGFHYNHLETVFTHEKLALITNKQHRNARIVLL